MDYRFDCEAERLTAKTIPAAHRDGVTKLVSAHGTRCGNATCVRSPGTTTTPDSNGVTVLFWGNASLDLNGMQCDTAALNLSCTALVQDVPRHRTKTPSKPHGMRIEIQLPMPTRAQLQHSLETLTVDAKVNDNTEAVEAYEAQCARFKSWGGRSALMSVAQVVDITKDWSAAMHSDHSDLMYMLNVAFGVQYLLYFPALDVYFASYNLLKTTLFGMYSGTFALRGGLQLFNHRWQGNDETDHYMHQMQHKHHIDTVARVVWSCYRMHSADVMQSTWCKFGIKGNAVARPRAKWTVTVGDNFIPLVQTAALKSTSDDMGDGAVVPHAIVSCMTTGDNCWVNRAMNNELEVFSSATLAASALAMASTNDSETPRTPTSVLATLPLSLQQLTQPVPTQPAKSSDAAKKKVMVIKKKKKTKTKKLPTPKKIKKTTVVVKKTVKKVKKRQREAPVNDQCDDVPISNKPKRRRVDKELDEEWCDFEFLTDKSQQRVEECALMDQVMDDDSAQPFSPAPENSSTRKQRALEVEREERRKLHASTVDMEMEHDQIMSVTGTDAQTAMTTSQEERSDAESESEADDEEESNSDSADGSNDEDDDHSDNDDGSADAQAEEDNNADDADYSGGEQSAESDNTSSGETEDATESNQAAEQTDDCQPMLCDEVVDNPDAPLAVCEPQPPLPWENKLCTSAPQLEETLTSMDLQRGGEMQHAEIQQRMDAFNQGLQLNNHVLHSTLARINGLLNIDQLDAAASNLAGMVNKLMRGDQGRPSKRTTDNIARLSAENESLTAVCMANASAIQGLAKHYKSVLQIVVKIEDTIQHSVVEDGAGAESANGKSKTGTAPRVMQMLAEISELMKDVDARISMLEFNVDQESRNSIRIRRLETQMETMMQHCQSQQQEIENLRSVLGSTTGPMPGAVQAPLTPRGVHRVRISGSCAQVSDKREGMQQIPLAMAPPLPARDSADPQDYDSTSPFSSASHEELVEPLDDASMQMIHSAFYGEADLSQQPKEPLVGAKPEDGIFTMWDNIDHNNKFMDDMNDMNRHLPGDMLYSM